MKRLIAIAVLVLPMSSIADVCPPIGEAVKTTPYTKTYRCSATSIIVEGETNPEKYQECLGDVPAAKEAAYSISGNKPRERLPSINTLAPKSDLLAITKVWMATDAHCQNDGSIVVDYWGGGNCRNCARSVQYTFDENGKFKKASLVQH